MEDNINNLRIVFNTHSNPRYGSHRIHFQHLRSALGPYTSRVAYNDWDHYQDFNVAIFQVGDREILRARTQNPDIIIGLTKLLHDSASQEEMSRADFLIADSWLERDIFLALNKPILVLRLVETLFDLPNHIPYQDTFNINRRAIIGYHGNLQHLEQIGGQIGPALEAINKTIPLTLRVIYDMENLGQWIVGKPKGIPIEEIQWKWETLCDHLNGCDVGIVPNFVWMKDKGITRRLYERIWMNKNAWLGSYPVGDCFMRFKDTANAGRALLFMQIGIPFVADMVPEIVEVVSASNSGVAVYTTAGWEHALRHLLCDTMTRIQMGENGKKWANENLSANYEAKKMLLFIINEFKDKLV